MKSIPVTIVAAKRNEFLIGQQARAALNIRKGGQVFIEIDGQCADSGSVCTPPLAAANASEAYFAATGRHLLYMNPGFVQGLPPFTTATLHAAGSWEEVQRERDGAPAPATAELGRLGIATPASLRDEEAPRAMPLAFSFKLVGDTAVITGPYGDVTVPAKVTVGKVIAAVVNGMSKKATITSANTGEMFEAAGWAVHPSGITKALGELAAAGKLERVTGVRGAVYTKR